MNETDQLAQAVKATSIVHHIYEASHSACHKVQYTIHEPVPYLFDIMPYLSDMGPCLCSIHVLQCHTCVSAGREVTHCALSKMLQSILIISPPCRLLLGEVSDAVRAAIGLVDPGLPDPPLGVPADPQEMGEAHPACCVCRPAACTTRLLTKGA